ncbi:MAG: hypothetical protein KCHDKBKB_00727 [Elusimicrobia bacterium]|nr:hypothetical protein [Elusimicrobiota bacterium]
MLTSEQKTRVSGWLDMVESGKVLEPEPETLVELIQDYILSCGMVEHTVGGELHNFHLGRAAFIEEFFGRLTESS